MIRLRRFVTAVRRWFAPVVLVWSLPLLAVMVVWIGVFQEGGFSWGKTWGNPPTEIEYSFFYDGHLIHYWHNDVVDSWVAPAVAKINADFKPPASNDPRFPFKPDYFEIGFDAKDPVDLKLCQLRRGDLRFSWDHTDPINFLGPPIGTYAIVDVPPRVPMKMLALLAIGSGIAVLRRPIKHLRRRHGFCRACGYNLTGNTSGVCPECGEIVVVDGKITP